MGLSIGQTAANLAAIQSASFARVNRNAQPEVRLEETNRVTRPDAAAEAEAQNARTASPQGLALRTLDINLEEARQIIPNLEEVQAEFREARAEALSQQRQQPFSAREREESEFRRVETVRPEPSGQVRRFEESAPPSREAEEVPELTPAEENLAEREPRVTFSTNRVDFLA